MQFTANKRLLLPHLLSDLSLVAGETHVDVQAAPYTRAQQKTTPSAQRNLSKSLEKWRTHVESGCGGDVMRDCIVMRRFWSKLFQKLYGCKRVWEMRNWESAGWKITSARHNFTPLNLWNEIAVWRLIGIYWPFERCTCAIWKCTHMQLELHSRMYYIQKFWCRGEKFNFDWCDRLFYTDETHFLTCCNLLLFIYIKNFSCLCRKITPFLPK